MDKDPASDNKSYGEDSTYAHSVRKLKDWRKVENWPYEVSQYGEVRRIGSRRILTGGWGGTNREYPVVTITDKGRHWTVVRHRLVAEAFLGPRPDGYEINHKDHNRANCHATNLEYVTPSENKLAAVANGYCGVRRYNAKLTEEIVRAIRQERASGIPVRQIALSHGITESAAYHVIRGSNWKHVK